MPTTPIVTELVSWRLGTRAAAAAVASAVALAGIAAYDPTLAAIIAVFAAGAAAAAVHPGLVAPFLAVAMTIGHWHPELAGVQAPALEAAAAGVAAGCLPRVIASGRRGLRPRGVDVVFAVFLAAVVLSGIGPTPKSAWAHDVLFWGSLTVGFSVAWRAMRASTFRVLFLFGIAIAGFVEATIVVVQYIEGSSGRFSLLGGAIVYPQPVGTLEHPNAAAPFLVICMLLLAGAALAGTRGLRVLFLVAAVVIGFASVLPYSRGGWISLVLGLLAWGAAQRKARTLLATFAALGAVLGLTLAFGGTFGDRLASLGSRNFSDLYGFRLTLAGRAARIILHHPLTGAGVFNEVGTYAGRPTLATHPHDLLLGVAVFFGIPAAIAFLAVVALAVRGALTATTGGSPLLRSGGVGAFAALVAFIVDGLFEYPFWNPALTVLAVGTFAYAIALGEARSNDGSLNQGMALPRRLDDPEVSASPPTTTAGTAVRRSP